VRGAVLSGVVGVAFASSSVGATTFYVRQTTGNDANDGRSPATAWQHVGMLSPAMRAGDTAYVGPGLYREEIDVRESGTPERPIVFVADRTGRNTGDPPGTVMLCGAEPVDEGIFAPTGTPGVYTAPFPAWTVWGVVEMDGPQSRYVRATITEEYLVEKLPPPAVVAKLRSSFFHDETTRTLYVHTSDDRPPAAHELELVQRGHGIFAQGTPYVTVVGFTFRHMQDSGVSFFRGASHGTVVGVTSWGSRQGVRIYASTDVLVSGSTLFRNENSGAYFAAASTGGHAVGNTSYENVKGLRWSSESAGAMALDNVLFDNSERGLSLENVDGAVVRGNRLANNAVSQLQVLQAQYTADDNCYVAAAGQLVADFTPFGFADRYPDVDGYRRAKTQDLHSQATCGSMPPKVDVHAMTSGGPPPRPFSLVAVLRRLF
jgi:Periplasmic copper-binding protein (NosD)